MSAVAVHGVERRGSGTRVDVAPGSEANIALMNSTSSQNDCRDVDCWLRAHASITPDRRGCAQCWIGGCEVGYEESRLGDGCECSGVRVGFLEDAPVMSPLAADVLGSKEALKFINVEGNKVAVPGQTYSRMFIDSRFIIII